MTLSVRQSVLDTSSGPYTSPTLPSTPTSGNLLIAVAAERSGSTAISMSNSGWTLAIDKYQSPSDSTYRKAFAIWYKIAGTSEPTSVTVTGGTGQMLVGLAEWQGDAGEMSSIAYATAVTTGSDTAASFYDSGSTSSVSSTNKLLVGFCYTKTGGGTEQPYSDWTAGTDDLTELREFNDGTNGLDGSWAWAASSTTGSNSTRATKDTSTADADRGAITTLLVFTIGSSGNGEVTAVAATASATALAPVVSGGGTPANVAAVPMTATAAAVVPVVTASSVVSAIKATATAAAVVPIVEGGTVVSGGGPMTATMTMLAPAVSGGSSTPGNVAAVVATATATAPAPAVSASASVQAVRATASAQMIAPAVSGQVVAAVNAIVATMTMLFRAPNVQAIEPTYAFYPPTHEEPMRTKVRPLNYYRLTHARSVVKVNGTYVQIYTPSAELLAGLEEGVDFFRGGYEYVVDRDTADALAADGFTATLI